MKVKSESEVAQSCPSLRTAAYQALPSMGFSRQEYWSGVPLPSLLKCSTWVQSQIDRMISVHFRDKPFNITIMQVYSPNSNAKEAEVEWFCEELQDHLELTPEKDALFITRDWKEKVGSQEIPGVTGKFGLRLQNEAGQRLIELCQEDMLAIANTLFQQHRR